MEMNDYLQEALKTSKHTQINSSCIYPALGLASEVGEVLGKIKKIFRDKDGKFSEDDKYAIAEEIGDCIWYCAILANEFGYNLETVAKLNIDKLKSRQERGCIQGNGDNR